MDYLSSKRQATRCPSIHVRKRKKKTWKCYEIHLLFNQGKWEYRKQSTANMALITLIYDPSNNSDNHFLFKTWNDKLSFNKSITMTKQRSKFSSGSMNYYEFFHMSLSNKNVPLKWIYSEWASISFTHLALPLIWKNISWANDCQIWLCKEWRKFKICTL